MWVDDPLEYQVARRPCPTTIPITFQMSIPGGGGGIYADTRRTLGHYLEYVHLLREVKDTYYADVPRY